MWRITNTSNTEGACTIAGVYTPLAAGASIQSALQPTSWTRQIKVVNLTIQREVVTGRSVSVKPATVYTDSSKATDKDKVKKEK